MNPDSRFQQLAEQGNPSGEVIAVDRFFITAIGLHEVGLHNQVLFENGDCGIIWEINGQHVIILNVTSETTPLGSGIVLLNDIFSAVVGTELLGRAISVLGEPRDEAGAISAHELAPVFSVAPPVIKRTASSKQLITGVMVVDMIFPIMLGQRMAVIGDTRTGKSTFLTQISANPNNADVYIYVLINKRKSDVENLLRDLQRSGALSRSVVIIADVFESLVQAYLAPYIGCAIAEYFCKQGSDVVIIYDDLSNHAKIYREIALLSHTSSGRDSYPGDIFYAHSSLLERAGSFSDNKKSITALPVVLTPDDDITGYLPTNLMSITDGQLIFNRENFQRGDRPAINTGLSVSRIGGRIRNDKSQELSRVILKKLADYARALEFSHFESGQSAIPKADIEFGARILDAFRQKPDETYNLLQQQLILEVALRAPLGKKLNMELLKKTVKALGVKGALTGGQYEQHLTELLALGGLAV
jgi:F-type H+-transporting ATPase subunit alpha